jgi:hypothetical protein
MNFFAFGIWAIAGLYLLAMICMCKTLIISIAILEAAADFVGSTFRIISVPIIFFFINVAVFFLWIVAAVCVFSVGEITPGTDTQAKHVVWDQTTRNMMYFLGFGILWIMAFLIACT